MTGGITWNGGLLSTGSIEPALCGETTRSVPKSSLYLTGEITTKEKDMKNKAYEFIIIALNKDGDYDETVWDEGPLAIIAKSAEEAKIKAVKYAPQGAEYGKDYTILVREIKGE